MAKASGITALFEKHLPYLMRLIAKTHGYSTGIQERLRLAMATGEDSEARKMAVLLPKAPIRPRLPSAQSARKRKGSS